MPDENKIKYTEDEIVVKLIKFIHECDADTLAGLFENAFGGLMTTEDGETYIHYLEDK